MFLERLLHRVGKNEIVTRTPFKIRAHHAMGQGYLYHAIDYPPGTEELLTGDANIFSILASKGREYYHDVIGNNPQNGATRWIKLMSDFITDFNLLKEQDLIHITDGKDRICGACAIGKHCEDSNIVEGDNKAFQKFLDVAQLLGLEEEADFMIIRGSNNIIRVETTKGVLVNVIVNQQRYFDLVYSK